MKIFVLDTNVLLHDPNALFVFQENHVVLPLAVIEEIDDQKKRQDEVGRAARQVSRELDELRSKACLSDGVATSKGGSIRVELNHGMPVDGWPEVLGFDKADNRILWVAWNLQKDYSERRVVLVSKDLNLRIKADVLGLATEDYRNDSVQYDKMYSGIKEIRIDAEAMEAFHGDGFIRPGRRKIRPNQCLVMKTLHNPKQSGLAVYKGGLLQKMRFSEADAMGIRARNKEQRFALELLLDNDIKVVTLAGPAGTGKTLLALAAGLERVLEDKAFDKLLVTRPVVPMGQDLGYLPGEKEDKLKPWMQPLFDNLDFLFRDWAKSGGKGGKPFGAQDYLADQGMLEIEALTYIRGRSIPNQFIICDEAQNLTPHMVKTLITRVGEGSKIVFTGDPEQIDHPYLDTDSNGLTCLVDRLKNHELSGHVSLVKGERSEVAEMGANLL